MKTFSLDQRAGLTHHKVHQKGHQLSWGGGSNHAVDSRMHHLKCRVTVDA